MIVDTSALMAILRDEPEAAACAGLIEAPPHPRLSAASFVEAAIVIDGSRDPVASRRFDDLIREARLVIAKQFRKMRIKIAQEVYRDFGWTFPERLPSHPSSGPPGAGSDLLNPAIRPAEDVPDGGFVEIYLGTDFG